ncbi:hypothetical protein [Zhihengliuella salsuginis]|uniref:Uncharacterized protein n=1 Tax=Zhihengliuella salsuginis TaxID=578222 RepID=A0ABQ3GG20_9MICC|nr:hypothetical protein [Zhihengliuella salsuginis]GHD02889.1 hypothetical protein GCM10008096_08520 [Zhihengliuella salsuginis]
MTMPAGTPDEPLAADAGRGTGPGESAIGVAGPFTLRELVVMIAGAVILLGSLIPFAAGTRIVNAWMFSQTQFNQFVFLLAPLLIAVGFAWRRLAGRSRVALFSLTLDQWGSVIGLLAAAYYFFAAVNSMGFSFLLCFVGALALVASTTTAHVVGGFAVDFVPGDGYLLARDIKPSAPARGTDRAGADAFGAPGATGTDAVVPGTATDAVVPPTGAVQPAVEPGPRPGAGPFWFAVPHPRDAFDEQTGMWAFTLEPGQWVLALADRGDALLVQHADGRVGLLRETGGIERA